MSQYPPPSGQPQQQLPSYAQPPGSSGYYGAPIGQQQFHMPVPDEPPQSNKKVNFGVRLIYIYVGCLVVGLIVDFLPGYQNDGDRVGEVISRGAPLVVNMLITAVSITVAIVVATFYKKGYTAARITAGVLAIVQGLFLLMQVALATVAILVVWMLTPDADKDNVFRVASENPLAVAAFIAAALLMLIKLVLCIMLTCSVFKSEPSKFTADWGAWRNYQNSVALTQQVQAYAPQQPTAPGFSAPAAAAPNHYEAHSQQNSRHESDKNEGPKLN